MQDFEHESPSPRRLPILRRWYFSWAALNTAHQQRVAVFILRVHPDVS